MITSPDVRTQLEPVVKPFEVTVGDKQFKTYTKFTSVKKLAEALQWGDRPPTSSPPVDSLKRHVEVSSDEWMPLCDDEEVPDPLTTKRYIQTRNAYWYSRAGRPMMSLMKHVNKAMYQAFILPLPSQAVQDWAIQGGRIPSINTARLETVISAASVVADVYTDGLRNIAPFVIFHAKSPSELRQQYGKGLWKTIANTTLSRNKLIVEHVLNVRLGSEVPPTTCKDFIAQLVQMPTWMLRGLLGRGVGQGWRNFDDSTIWARSVLIAHAALLKSNGKRSPINEIVRLSHFITALSRNHTLAVTSKWSVRRINEEHNKYVKQSFLTSYSPEEFHWYAQFPIKTFSYTDTEGNVIEFTLKKSALEIGEEGFTMCHCVGSYARNSASFNYLVFSGLFNGVRTSTLGLNVSWLPKVVVSHDQQYGHRNSLNIPESMRSAAIGLIDRINSCGYVNLTC